LSTLPGGGRVLRAAVSLMLDTATDLP